MYTHPHIEARRHTHAHSTKESPLLTEPEAHVLGRRRQVFYTVHERDLLRGPVCGCNVRFDDAQAHQRRHINHGNGGKTEEPRLPTVRFSHGAGLRVREKCVRVLVSVEAATDGGQTQHDGGVPTNTSKLPKQVLNLNDGNADVR